MTDRYNSKMETQEVDEDRVFYHKKLNKMLVLECGHPEDGALYLMREYDMFNNDFLNEPHCIIYYAVEKTDQEEMLSIEELEYDKEYDW